MVGEMTYKGSGVDYDPIDDFKRRALNAARTTNPHLKRLGLEGVEWSRGESTFLLERGAMHINDRQSAVTLEELGTKIKIADAIQDATGVSHHDKVAECNAATALNDVASLAIPTVFLLHLAAGASSWFEDEKRGDAIIEGTRRACQRVGCVWGGGETSVLKGIVMPDTAMLGCVATGVRPPNWIKGKPEDGDVIVFLSSSGIHANGITLAREVAEKLPQKFLTLMPDGRTYGEVLLEPTELGYADLLEECLMDDIDIHYVSPITGHGWRKIMRSEQSFRYVIERLPKQLPVFDFIQERGPVAVKEMYGNYNMGVGLSVKLPEPEAQKMLAKHAEGRYGFGAMIAGYVEKSDEKKVIVEPIQGLEFVSKELNLR